MSKKYKFFCLSHYVYFFGLCVTGISPLSLIQLLCVCSEVWLCPILCNPMECMLTGSSVCGILQVRTLEWVAMPSSKGSSWPSNQTCVFCISCTSRWILLPTTPPGKPHWYIYMHFNSTTPLLEIHLKSGHIFGKYDRQQGKCPPKLGVIK